MAKSSDHSDHDPFDAGHLIGHVKDAPHFEVPRMLSGGTGVWDIPQIRKSREPFATVSVGFKKLDDMIEPLEGKVTKFMVLEVVAATLVAFVFIRLAGKMSGGGRPRGRAWNMLEALLVFLRDEVARPCIGDHDVKKFLPLIWTIFFFVLGCNLLGLVPWMGSPTGALATTGALALITFLCVIVTGMVKIGPISFWTGQVPPMELPLALAIVLKPMIFVIEIFGMLIKHFVLSVRLLANMTAGHLVLAVLLAFISASWQSMAVWGIAPVSILGATAFSMLELFVSFLQAYIFAFLTALFIGMAVHPH
ncbi:MAG: F0F1 ATP synthase subunit A [Planctomycetes bacterium]|nr:F0F1 ATP synthase subunit A [Planctomycetota bacterium]